MAMQLTILMALLLQCTKPDNICSDSYLYTSLYYTSENTMAGESSKTRQQDTSELYNDRLHHNGVESDGYSKLEYPDYFYDKLLEEGPHDTCKLDNAVEYGSTIISPLSNVIANSVGYAQLQSGLPLPADYRFAESFASSALPELQDPMTSGTDITQPPLPMSDTLATASNSNELNIYAVEIPNLNDNMKLSYGTEAGASSTVRNDKKHRLFDLEKGLRNKHIYTLSTLRAVNTVSNNITKYYRNITQLLYNRLMRLFERCMRWKRMTLGYTYNPGDTTKVTISQLHVSFGRSNNEEPRHAFRFIDACGRECWVGMYHRIFKLHSEIVILPAAPTHYPPIQPGNSGMATNTIVSYAQLVETANDPEIRPAYRKILTELPHLAASLTGQYSLIAPRIGLICEHAAFFDDIIISALNLAKELAAMHTSLENAVQQKMKPSERNYPLSNRRKNDIAKEVYGTSTTIEWIKNRCEQILKLCYELRQYDPLGMKMFTKRCLYRTLTKLEVPYNSICTPDRMETDE